METKTNNKELWNEIYKKEDFSPGWAFPGLDKNIVSIVKKEISNLRGDVSVLDIGCGNGRNSLLVEELGKIKYTGADFADKAIEYCSSFYSMEKKFINLDITADALQLKGHFDIIIDCGCFHAIPPDKREKYIMNLKKLSAKDSLIIIGAWWREPNNHEVIKPTLFPYIVLNEWALNKQDMESIFNGNFFVENELICKEIYHKLNKSFAYFTLRVT